MKLLFERLSPHGEWELEESVRQCVFHLTATQTLPHKDVLPGILNFGLPNVVDFNAGKAAVERYGKQLAERIRQFEPRIAITDIQVVNGTLQLTAQVQGESRVFTWNMAD